MTYTVEDGIPIPAKKTGAKCGARTEWTRTLEKMQVGQSVLTPDPKDAKAADQYRHRSRPRDYVVRKVPRIGWRVWRIA